VSASIDGLAGPDLLEIRAVRARGANMDEVRGAVDHSIARLRAAGPSPAELGRAKQRLETELRVNLESRVTRAGWLAERMASGKSRDPVAEYLALFNAVSAADIQKAVNDYLTPGRRTVIEVYPPELLDPPPKVHTLAKPNATNKPVRGVAAHAPTARLPRKTAACRAR
jgi:zinc protease